MCRLYEIYEGPEQSTDYVAIESIIDILIRSDGSHYV